MRRGRRGQLPATTSSISLLLLLQKFGIVVSVGAAVRWCLPGGAVRAPVVGCKLEGKYDSTRSTSKCRSSLPPQHPHCWPLARVLLVNQRKSCQLPLPFLAKKYGYRRFARNELYEFRLSFKSNLMSIRAACSSGVVFEPSWLRTRYPVSRIIAKTCSSDL